MRIVIRAGGTGTRLWPMSRQHNPKQFQRVIGDQTMIRATYERIRGLLGSVNDLFISVNHKMLEKIKLEIPEVNLSNVIVETDTRNTGPAVCLEVCYLEKFCQPNEIIASLTSDDYISNSQDFCELLEDSEKFLQRQPENILAIAVAPDYPDTGYTYFQIGEKVEAGDKSIYKVAKVVEKPNIDLCNELVSAGDYYCHVGMYVWQLGYISKLFQKLQPRMYKTCEDVVDMMNRGDLERAKELYLSLEKMTIESAITNKTENLIMSVSNRFGWSDLGKWHIIKRILATEGENLTKGEVVIHDAQDNLVYNNNEGRIIVLNDVHDLIIIDTNDVLLISSSKKSAEIKNIVEKLKQQNKEKYL
ncbi:MAG: sugar phosphate nucleotidyltransferase [bacterium]